MADEQQQEKAYDQNREGARWVNRKPSGPEFAAWFSDNVKIDEALDADDYIGGIVLIPAVETVQEVTGVNPQSGEAIIAKRKQLTYTPYPKVETRVQYFWDLLDSKEKWRGVVEPITTDRPSTEPVTVKEQVLDGDRIVDRETQRVPTIVQTVEQLPPGFFVMSVPVGNEIAHYLCASYKVEIWERNPEGNGDDLIVRSGRGTKMVPLVTSRTWDGRTTIKPDDNSIMKAETGAIGRAIALAGIFNIPGSGVATAEDMFEALNAPGAGVQPEADASPTEGGPAAPTAEPAPQRSKEEEQADEHKAMIARARELVGEGSNLPGVLDAFKEWGEKRNPPVRNLGNLRGAALRGAIKKLEKLVEEGKQRAAEQGDTPPPEPAEPPTPEPEEPDVAGHPATQSDEAAPPPVGEPPAEAGDAGGEPG
jgi:hypothetical protein